MMTKSFESFEEEKKERSLVEMISILTLVNSGTIVVLNSVWMLYLHDDTHPAQLV
jgi:hypothetical protein